MDAAHLQRLADGSACLDAALKLRAKFGWSMLALCPPDHVGVGLVNRGHIKSCDSKGKRPWYPWQEYQKRAASEKEITDLFKRLPNSNLGLALGPVSRVVRVDIEGALGEAKLLELAGGTPPATVEFWSGRVDASGQRGGRGLLYGIPEGSTAKTKTFHVGPGAEVRFQGEGAQTVIPPSRHPSTNLYEWLPGQSPFDMAVTPAPEWLLKWMQSGAPSGGSSSPLNRAYGVTDLESTDWPTVFAGTQLGGRNDNMAKAIGKLLAATGDFTNETLGTVWECVKALNERNSPPLDEKELGNVYRSIVNREREKRNQWDGMVERDLSALAESGKNLPNLLDLEGRSKALVDNSLKTPEVSENHDGLADGSENGKSVNENHSAQKTESECTGAHESGAAPTWHLKIVNSDPPEYLLLCPWWSGASGLVGTGGYLTLNAQDILSWSSSGLGIPRAAFIQANVVVPPSLKDWGKVGGHLDKLVAASTTINVVAERKRIPRIAIFTHAYLTAPSLPEATEHANGRGIDTKSLPGSGSPVILPGGDVAFKIAHLCGASKDAGEKWTQDELAKVFESLGMKKQKLGNTRWWIANKKNLADLVDLFEEKP